MNMTSAELIELTGITYRQLDYWTTQGYLHADANNPGSGNCRNYDGDEVAIAWLMAELVRAGMRPAPAADLAREELDAPIPYTLTEAVA